MQLALLESVFQCAHGDSRGNNREMLPVAWIMFCKLRDARYISAWVAASVFSFKVSTFENGVVNYDSLI